jgi:hypothetical protein
MNIGSGGCVRLQKGKGENERERERERERVERLPTC